MNKNVKQIVNLLERKSIVNIHLEISSGVIFINKYIFYLLFTELNKL